MLVTIYNNDSLDDLLIVCLQPDHSSYPIVETKGTITRIAAENDPDKTIGYNFFHASKLLNLKQSGSVTLTQAQVDVLNDALAEAGFKKELVADEQPKFVVGYVKECTPHEDSDHLFVTKTEVDNGEILQIVCGAPNIAAGQKVVVAKPGAVMPNGLIIWPGQLRGVSSHGMICSSRELGIEPQDPSKRGILVLSEQAVVGEAFSL
ncbi:YtpR family tRNA-binding protein [Allofustis seminis]|uniref:YtpR family tRNA-binding protein n=1 Tax=Allofustis seminis TaxID=166939 RepID=UPI00037D45EE|nr:DUF4479 and tRNA-binding domain-containing protein [Allofustis seminis]